jgi:hypothetical protein
MADTGDHDESGTTDPLDTVTERLNGATDASLFAGYSDGYQPMGGYIVLTAAFNTALTAALVSAHRRGRLPEEIDTKDILVLGLATHKVARLVTKDSVTSFLRAPFVRLEARGGTNSTTEHARGRGLRRSVGELLSCPECTGHWVAAGLMVGLVHAPRLTRLIGALYASLTIGDLLQYVYVGLKSRA